MRTYFRWIVFGLAILTITAPVQLYAACQIVGTTMDGYIIVCDGPDTIGVASSNGSDIIIINAGADVTKTDLQSTDSTATATATTINAGGGNNQVTNNGSVGANAGANALPVDGSASQATATATAIKAGSDPDVIQNFSTITSTATSNSTSGDISLTLDGSNQSQSTTTSTADATGIAGGGGNNQITNSGVITVTGTSQSDATFIDLTLTDTAYADVSVKAESTGTGISAEGSIVNQQTGTITVTVSSSATTGEFNANIGDSAKADANTTAKATATGIAGSGAKDTITSAGTITVNATSNAEGSVDLESSTDAEINATIEVKSSAIGIDGRGGDDTITNQSTLSATSTATAASDNINASIWAPGVTDTTVKSNAESTGILSGSGKDVITNEGSITIYSEATTELSNVLLSGGIEVALPTDVKGGATSEATAIGVDVGDGDDKITNNSTINASSKASTSSEGVLLTVVGIGTFATPTTSTARSTGIDGGAGKDEITNSGTITANATSNAKSLSVSVSALQYEAASDGDAKTRSEAYAIGIAGGDGDDKVTNTGTVTANANATASTTDITVEGLGASRSNSSTTAGAFATGINGGIGNDEISNSGTITANATSEVNAVGVDLKYIALPLQPAQWFGADLGEARTEAQATATGIDGGEGDDTISNSGTIDVYANAKADSDKIVSMLEIQSVSKSPQAAVSGGNLQASPAVGATSTTTQAPAAGAGNSEGDNEITNTGTIAQTTATGIAGGAGNDTIANNNNIYAKVESEANSLSISATIAIGKGGTLDLIPDSAIIDATTTAQATVKGIDGGIGNDTITNLNEVNAEAISNATSASIGVLFKGVTEFKSATGIALSDATTKALSTATGIAGGDGDDTITNSGKIKSTATSDADSASISVALVGLKEGLVGGVSYADATTTAEATTIGIDGGAGDDTISNMGEVEVIANSTSSSASIGLTVSGAFSQEWSAAFGVTLTDGTTKAISNATGINGGDGIDIITNFNKNTVTSTSDADSASVSVSLVGAEDGLTLGVSYADNTTTAEANAVGIDGSAGNDTIINTSTGQIEVTADPTSSSASVSATITGVTKGTGIVGGAALTDGTTKAISNVAGIKGGDGDDTIANFGKIIVRSNPDADSASVAVNLGAATGELGLVGGFSYADATTTAEATAIGIDGGSGNDTIYNTGEIEVTTKPSSSSASIAMSAQGVKGMGAAVGVSLTDGTTKAISTATGIAGGDGDDTIINSGRITVKALPDADSASVSVSISAAKEGVAAGGTFADTTTIAQATATGIDGGQGNDTINNSGMIEVAANSTSSAVSIGATITGVKEGAGLGVALTDGTTKAISTATGIKGGDGNNIIANSGNITVTATSDADSASVSAALGGTGEGLVAGVSYADATTKAEATAIGIETGRGNDIIQNDGVLNVTSEATATSASVAVNAGGAIEGAAVGVALTDAETRAKSSSTGIEGGEGENTITNTGTITISAKSDVTAASVSVDFEATGTGVAGGASLANGDTTVEAYAFGINNGSGKGTIINDNVISVNAESTSTLASISVAVHGTPEGISLGAALASASNTAKASAIGIQGGNDNDIIANTGTITVSATTNADTTSVALDAECAPVGLGASLAKANTTAEAIATGLSGGSGDDEITNTGTINANSSSTASSKAISVSIATASYSSADVSTTATAKSTGMDAGSGADLLRNEGTIDLKATSKADGKAGSANLTGYAASDVNITAEATTTGVDGGAEYSDIDNLINTGTIKTLSDATAKGLSVSVNLLGGVATDANTTARAITTGINAGAGGDLILNQGNIELTAKSNADVLGVSVTLGGYSDSNAESKGESTATGINAGDGVNTITSTGSIKVSSEAYADTASVSVNLLGYAAAKGGATASATAIGIASGKDADSIRNEGMIDLNALSDTDASAASVQLIGYGESSARAISAPTVKGIDGGDGNNTIINTSTGVIMGTATAYADASSYDIQLAGGAKTTAGTEAIATAIGIAGGKDMDTIRNEGTINLAAGSTLVSESRSYKIFGVGFADANSMALALATGIDGGDGINTIINASTGSITASSNASATATGMTANIGVAGSSASTTSKAQSTGMKSGGGEDTIINEGILNVKATSSTYAGSGDFSLIGLSFGDALTEAITEGIVAGDGKDVIINNGTITVGTVLNNDNPMAYSNVDSVSLSFFNISSATFGSKAQATGIIGGGGDDTILNAGTITVGDEDWMAKGRAYGFSGNFFEFFSMTSVGATAETVSTGIEGGDGNDTILNDGSGVLTVKATSYARTEGAADTSTFGNPAAFASSTTKATAIGISGGEGNDFIENKGAIDVYAHTWADAYSDSWVGWGEPSSDSTADATATAAGVNAGEGQNFVMNSGVINVKALAETTPYAKADSNVDTTDAETTSYSKSTAFGILAGDGGNTVNNTATGAITVTAIARTYDAQGNIAKAESDEKSTVTAGSVNTPITADAVGVSLGKGDDTVTNDGTITVSSQSDARVSAYTNSWPYDAQSDATAYAAATAKGIVAGVGANEVINNGKINVSAWSNANPITDSWSRDQTAIANATADSKAIAIGIEADGNITNALNGSINVTARTTTYADANTNAETTKATANLMATATGIGTASSTGRAVPDRIQNDGIITVNALAGEDENGNPKTIALADTDVNVRSDRAEATGTSTVDAAGIRVGDNDSVITNNGNLTVLGRALAYVSADAFSRDYNPTANAYSNANSSAVGIQAEGGSNIIRNSSLIDVDALAEARAQGWADSWSSRTYTNVYASSIANATGVSAGNGNNIIDNEDSGAIDVNSVATGTTYPSSDENAKVGTSKDDPKIKASATATGISAGGGTNRITNDGSITVKATATRNGNAFAESDAYDTETIIWAAVDASATGIATGTGSNQIINNGVLMVSSIAYSEIYSDSDSVDDADATGGATVTARAWGINASGNNALVINTGTLDVDATATAKGNSRADSGGAGYGEAIFEANSNADAIGISAGDGGTVWNQAQAQITVDAKAMIDASANGDERGKIGTSNKDPGAIAVATAAGISMGNGNNQIINDGSISVNAEGNINANSRSLSTTRSTYTNTWAMADATATGLTVGKGESSIINTGDLEVNAKAIAYLNDPNSGWGTYWRSDSWYNADAKTGAYAYSNATGIEASADNSDNPGNIIISNSGVMNVTSAATAKGNAAGDRGGDDYGSATTYAEASAEAYGFVVGNDNRLVSIENSGSLDVASTADTLAFSHGDSDSWSYAKSLGYAYGIKVGNNNELVFIKNSGTMKVESTAKSNTEDDEPWRQSDASSNVYGIKIGNSNSVITNSGVLDIRSTATAKLYTDEDTAVSTVSSAYATGISTGNGVNTISSNSQIQVIATAESNPDGGNSNSTNTDTAQAIGIKTGSNSDTIILGTGGLFNVAANATTFSYNGETNASAIGIDAGDGANQIINYGSVSTLANANTEVVKSIFIWDITWPATANSSVTGIKSGTGADIINNYGQIMVNSWAWAVSPKVPDLSVAGTKNATANAIGIDAGNGDNFVANYGSIDVSALAAAGTGANPNARTDGVESTTAIGIKTGDGDDTIINSGTINTANQRLEWVGGWVYITSQPGIAISSGGGNDQVFLMNGSTTTGSIDLGDGDDWLTLVGTPVVTGNVTGAAGIDTLVFDGAGSIGFTPMAFENAIKQGAGTFNVANLPTMQRIEIKQGVLQVNNNYQFSNSGFFQTIVNGDGSFGQFKVNGTTELAGDLNVLKGPGPFLNGTTYNIIEANAVNNAFSNVVLPAPNNFVSFGMNQFPTLVQIEVYAKDFTWLVRNRVEWAVANYLDRILPSATGDLFGMLGQIQNLSQSEFYKALSSLSPDSYDNFTRTTFSATHRYTKSLQYRMNNVRSYLYANGSGNEAPILLAYRGSDVSQLYNPERVSQIQGKNGLWFDAFGQWGDQGAKKGYTGYDYFMRGAILGFDHAVSDKLMAGVSVGYSRADVDLDRHQGSGDIKSLFGSIYGSYFNKNLYIDGALSYGRNWYDNHRLVTIGPIQRKAYSDHEGDLFAAYFGGGYYFDIKKWLIGPFASLQYVYLDEGSFKEKGADSLNLRVDDRQTGSLVSELGVRLARVFKTKYGSLIPEVSAAWLHDFDIDDRVITSSFTGSPGASFSMKGQDVERNGASLGAGITFVHKSGFSTSLKYKGEFREKYKSNTIMGELRFTF